MILTLDSSVIIAALREQEEKHKECLELLEKVKNREHTAIEPYIVLVEVTSAIRRRTSSEELAEKVKKNLQELDSIYFMELESERANEASDISIESGVRGMDAIVVQIAKEFNTILVSLDDDITAKAKDIVKMKSVDKLINN